MVYSHGSKHSSGTLVLFNPSLDVEMENHETDQRGRLIILRAKIEEYRSIFINVYAPNDQKCSWNFFETLELRLRKYADENITIGGDLNCCLTKHLLPQVKDCNITPVSFSDHSAVLFNIQSDNFMKRGPGFFKFNNSLLNDHCFVEGLSKEIPEYKEK